MDNDVLVRKPSAVERAVAIASKEAILGAVNVLAIIHVGGFARLRFSNKITGLEHRIHLHISEQHVRTEINEVRDLEGEKTSFPGPWSAAVRGVPSRATAGHR